MATHSYSQGFLEQMASAPRLQFQVNIFIFFLFLVVVAAVVIKNTKAGLSPVS
jgi:hypothetical protein